MRHLLITIGLCLFIIPSGAQKIYPYTITDRQVDSLHVVLAHTDNDSLKMEITTIFAIYYSENDQDSSLYFTDRVITLATKLDLPPWKSLALSRQGYLYSCMGDFPKSWQANDKAFQIAGGGSFYKNLYRPRLITGIPAWLTSRECLLSDIYEIQAHLYGNMGDYDKAAASNAEAMRIAEKTGDRESLSQYRNMCANIYAGWTTKITYDSAILLEQEALNLCQGAEWQYYTGDIYGSLGWFYRYEGNYPASLSNFKLCAVTSHQQHNLSLEYLAYVDIAALFLDMRQPDSTIAYCGTARAFSSRVKQEFSIAALFRHLSAAYRMKGNLDSAFAYLMLSKQLGDSLNAADKAQALQYQKVNLKERLSLQEAENERNRQQARMITYATLTGLGIASLILFLLYRNNRQKQKTNRALTEVRDLQNKKISQLDEAVTKRTEQLNTFRQAMATDFHDQTGNMLSAITRQAMMLKIKLNGNNADVLPVVESIIANSNELYDSSKDFLWNLNHNSDDPLEVFQYLVNYGQVFYNQFNIPFSSSVKGEVQPLQQLDDFAALNLIYIFKEAMTNVVKHAGASEVMIELEFVGSKVMYALHDNGRWKPEDEATSHYGLANIGRRCEKNNFGFLLSRQNEGTRIEIAVPVSIDFIG